MVIPRLPDPESILLWAWLAFSLTVWLRHTAAWGRRRQHQRSPSPRSCWWGSGCRKRGGASPPAPTHLPQGFLPWTQGAPGRPWTGGGADKTWGWVTVVQGPQHRDHSNDISGPLESCTEPEPHLLKPCQRARSLCPPVRLLRPHQPPAASLM